MAFPPIRPCAVRPRRTPHSRRAKARSIAWLVVPALLGAAPRAAAQAPDASAARLLRELRLDVGGLLQTQLNTTSAEVDEPVELLLRRARFRVEAQPRAWMTLVLQPDFGAEGVELNEGYIDVAFAPALQLRAGKAGRPFGVMDATSATQLLPIERGARIRGRRTLELYGLLGEVAYAGRSVGVQLRGAPERAPLGLTYAAGYFAAAPSEEGADAFIRQLAGRVTIDPAPRLQIGVALSSRAFRGDTAGGGAANAEARRGSAFAIDARYGAFDEPGVHAVAEWSAGVVDPFTGDRYRGGQLWTAVRSRPVSEVIAGVEPMLRLGFGRVDGERAVDGGVLLTPGLNVYFGGGNRVMANYDVWLPERGKTASSFKLQLQAAF